MLHRSKASFGIGGARRLSRQITRATVLILLTVTAMVVGGLLWATQRSDAISIQRQERTARHAMGMALDELALQQETVAVWDESVARMVAGNKDQTWLYDNVGSWLFRIFKHDESWLLDEQGRLVQVVVDGRQASSAHVQRLRKDVEPLIMSVGGGRRTPVGTHDRQPGFPAGANVRTTSRATHDTHLMLVGGRPAAVSAMLFQPSTPGYVGQRQGWPILVSIRYLDGSFMRELEAKNLIRGARFSHRDDPRQGETAIAVSDERGVPLGYLIWRPELPGSRMIKALLPANLVALLVLTLIMAALLRRLTQSVRERGRLEERAKHLGYHDALTGLPNRVLLGEGLGKLLRQKGTEVALLLIDLDRFKQVNDTLGHLAGDELIRQFARRLKERLALPCVLARLGGDEFAIAIGGKEAVAAMSWAETVLSLFAEPFEIEGHAVHGGASIGVAIRNDVTLDATEMMRRADVALYRAKADGRNCARLFRARMDAASKRRARLEADLRTALTDEQFALWRQPQVDRHGAVVGQEVLLRWRHPEQGLISPDRIIPVAEETGLILPLGDWVLRNALLKKVPSPEFIAINLSPAQLRQDGFASRALDLCAQTGISPAQVEMEITERTLLEDSRVIRHSLRRLREAGFRLALDDFGTGYSSLSYLRRLPVDKIKIDRSFVADLDRSATARAIVAAIATLGRALELTIAAEGVETALQEEILLSAGCDQLQGYRYARPAPLELQQPPALAMA